MDKIRQTQILVNEIYDLYPLIEKKTDKDHEKFICSLEKVRILAEKICYQDFVEHECRFR